MISNYKVLYAEDEKEIRKVYVDIFKNYFKEVIEASNGSEAYKKYIEYNPDLLILDINMPILNGLDLAKKVRKENKDIKIIILSALEDKDTFIQACELNLLKYLLKPVKNLQLDEILTKTISEIDDLNKNILFDTKNSIIIKGDKKIKLTKNEISLLKFLTNHTSGIISNEAIVNYIWEDNIDNNNDTKNKLRVLVSRLNKKVSNEIIISTYGIGYQLNYEIVIILK